MKTLKCEFCGAMFPESIPACPECGAPNPLTDDVQTFEYEEGRPLEGAENQPAVEKREPTIQELEAKIAELEDQVSENKNSGCGCGTVILIIVILVILDLLFGGFIVGFIDGFIEGLFGYDFYIVW